MRRTAALLRSCAGVVGATVLADLLGGCTSLFRLILYCCRQRGNALCFPSSTLHKIANVSGKVFDDLEGTDSWGTWQVSQIFGSNFLLGRFPTSEKTFCFHPRVVSSLFSAEPPWLILLGCSYKGVIDFEPLPANIGECSSRRGALSVDAE